MTDPKAFWEDKILGWEDGRYHLAPRRAGPLEWIADRASRSLRFRLESAGRLLSAHAAGRRVVEIGCGSGLLAPQLIAAGAASYHGIDIAEAAIRRAEERATGQPWAAQARFTCAALADLPALEADLVFSLGVLDWLTDAELETLFRLSGPADFLHAIAEDRPSLARWLHQAYVHVSYGHRTGTYVPRYVKPGFVAGFARRVEDRPLRVWRDPGLAFGAYVTSLPIGDPLQA